MLKVIELFNKLTFGKNNGNKLILVKNNNNNEIDRPNVGNNNIEHIKKLRKSKNKKLFKA